MKPIEKMTSAELKVFLEDRNMPTNGNKTELLLRAKKAVAEQPSSSTPVRQERDVTTDIDHVASANGAEDDAAQHVATEGEIATTAAATGGEDKNADAFAFDDFDDDDHDDDPLKDPKAIEFKAKQRVIQEKFSIVKEREKLEDDDYRIKQEMEDKEFRVKIKRLEQERHEKQQIEDDKHRKLQEIQRKRRELDERTEINDLACKLLGLPKLPASTDTASTEKVDTSRSTGKTDNIDSAISTSADRVDVDDDVTVLKSKPITITAGDRVCSDLKQTASHVTEPTISTPDVRPKTSTATPTAASTNITPAKTPIPKPRVSIARDFNEQRAVYDKHGKFVGYVSDSGGLVLTDPHATAPLIAQAAVAANTTLPTTPANPAPLPQSTPTGYVPPLDPNASVYQPSFTSSQGTDKSFKQLVDLMSLPKPNLLTFSGDPLSYHTFMNAFDTCIDSADVTDAAKLNRLLELCQGKARAVIKSCTLKEPSAGYAQARQRLRERFGDSFVIFEAWV